MSRRRSRRQPPDYQAPRYHRRRSRRVKRVLLKNLQQERPCLRQLLMSAGEHTSSRSRGRAWSVGGLARFLSPHLQCETNRLCEVLRQLPSVIDGTCLRKGDRFFVVYARDKGYGVLHHKQLVRGLRIGWMIVPVGRYPRDRRLRCDLRVYFRRLVTAA